MVLETLISHDLPEFFIGVTPETIPETRGFCLKGIETEVLDAGEDIKPPPLMILWWICLVMFSIPACICLNSPMEQEVANASVQSGQENTLVVLVWVPKEVVPAGPVPGFVRGETGPKFPLWFGYRCTSVQSEQHSLGGSPKSQCRSRLKTLIKGKSLNPHQGLKPPVPLRASP